MKSLILSGVFSFALTAQALAWGQEGHSIVAEIAQRRLSPAAADLVKGLLGPGHSLASVASWADTVRDERPETYRWHFVDMPINVTKFNQERDCKDEKKSGDCIIAELGRVKKDLLCAPRDKKTEALKFAVHFLGDIHQPLHTVDEFNGGNEIKVEIFMRGLTCTAKCEPKRKPSNFHTAWDTDLIQATAWSWGAYVDRLEEGWLKSAEANRPGIDGGNPEAWAEETHKFAPIVWNSRPADNVLDDRYLRDVLPTLDRQLGVAGLRLAKFLNDVSAEKCPAPR